MTVKFDGVGPLERAPSGLPPRAPGGAQAGVARVLLAELAWGIGQPSGHGDAGVLPGEGAARAGVPGRDG